jgi:hypothetical protein
MLGINKLIETLADQILPERTPSDRLAQWRNITHRAGWILQAKQSTSGLPPYDPKAEWTEAARQWALFTGEESESAKEALAPDDDGDRTLPFPKAATDELLLGAVRAKRAARIVMREHEHYNSFVAGTIGAHGDIKLTFRSESPAVRFDPGLIVDLPAFSMEKRGREIATGRLCLTVCMHESRSKIWTRISSVNDEAWGSTPCAQLRTLVAQSREWFASYAVNVVRLYEKHIGEALATTEERRDTSVTLSVRNRIELVSGDTGIPGLASLTSAIANHDDVYAEGMTCEAAEQLDAIACCAPDTGISRDGTRVVDAILRSDSSKLGLGRYYLVPHRTARGFRGVYLVRAWDERLLFVGIASTDSDPLVTVRPFGVPSRFAANSPSQHVTAELANTVAKYF